jgi:hypothetical protein
MVSVAVCVPSQENIGTMFVNDLVAMIGWHMRNTDDDVSMFFNYGASIAELRQDITLAAMGEDPDFILFLNPDMRFPHDTLKRLLEHDKDIVAANYVTNTVPIMPVATQVETLAPLYTDADAEGLEQAAGVGMGVMLVKGGVIKALDDPLFIVGYSPNSKTFQDAETFFCRKAQMAGFGIYVDHGLSQAVAHIGGIEYTNAHGQAVREALGTNALAAE